MSKVFYPAIFHEAEEGGFWVSFPDIPECFTQGDNMQQAYEMAVEALGLSLKTMKASGIDIPKASELSDIIIEKGYLVEVAFDPEE